MKYEVSVIIPFYNAKQFVESSVDCMINQSFKNFEVIYINDGSIDGGEALLKKKIKNYSNMKCIDQENKGLGESRNVGMQYASGKYIYFLDIDDCIVYNALEVMVIYAQKYSAEIVTVSSINVDESVPYTKSVEEISKEKILGGLYVHKAVESDNVMSGSEYICKNLNSNTVFPVVVWIYLFERNFLKKNNLKFLPIVHEDNVFIMDTLLRAHKVISIDRVLHWRRCVSTSIMNQQKTEKHVLGALYAMNKSVEHTKYAMKFDKKLARSLHGWNVLNCGIAYEDLLACNKKIRKKFKWILVKDIFRNFRFFKIQILIKALFL